MTLQFGPPYRIVTPRLVLRCWEPADAPALAALVERNVDFLGRWRWRGTEGEPLGLEDRLSEVRGLRADLDSDAKWSYAVLTADEGALAGPATLFRGLGGGLGLAGWCGTEYDGQGYAAEAGAALARTAFELFDAPRLQAACLPGDAEATTRFRELGFTHDGTARHLNGGARRDEMLWSLLPGEWPASPAAARAADASAFGVLGHRLF
ncbi:MAG TPA: GNAT family protein [Longimicrobium sp.]|jgi:RimJ/RimL family protein N-acetyltransferase|nr:GNAT family protein [Longimicrobium sp.]